MSGTPHVDPRALLLHDAAVSAGRDTYADPVTGYSVFTSACLAARGSCCDSGCRHCPFRDAPAIADPVDAAPPADLPSRPPGTT